MSKTNFTQEISKCKNCEKYASSIRLKTDEKSFVKFRVEKKWKPRKIKVLFIAESPPWQGYFYDQKLSNNRTCLRKEVLYHLKLKSLEDFKAKGYYLIDAIKCRLNKREEKNVPRKISRNCSDKFLYREINQSNPETIFVLGNTAKKNLQRISKFSELKQYKITEGFDGKVSDYYIILSVYPGGQTKMHYSKIEEAFAKLV